MFATQIVGGCFKYQAVSGLFLSHFLRSFRSFMSVSRPTFFSVCWSALDNPANISGTNKQRSLPFFAREGAIFSAAFAQKVAIFFVKSIN